MNASNVPSIAPPLQAAHTDVLGPDGWPVRRLAWTTVAVLGVAQAVNAIDRHLINLLVGPIKADLAISDTQVGLLLGFAFALFYTFLGLPIGRWADSHSRRLIIACGSIFWSVSTIACGFANSFWHLFFARMSVGAGEATLNPSGYSLISDYFPPERRAKPMGVFIMGHTLGTAFTLFAGGAFVQYLVSHGITWTTPWGAVLRPWQIAFFCAGLPGFLVFLLILTLREPPRREMIVTSAAKGAAPASVPVREIVAYFFRHARVYAPMFLGFGCVLLWEMGRTLWAPTYFIRTFGWAPREVGMLLGVMTLVFTSGGAVASGWVAERLALRGYRDANLRAAFVATLISLPFAVTAMFMPTPALAVLFLCPAYFLGAFPFALAPAAISTFTPNQMRAQITALYLLTINLLGFGLGPAVIGGITDHVFGDESQLRYSMALTAAVAIPVAAALLWRSMHAYSAAILARTASGDGPGFQQ